MSISSHLELQDDAMSPLCCIFGNPVFERPYSDLSIFSHVGCTRKLKKTYKKALKTFLVAHCEKTHLEITHGSENVKKTTPTEVQMDDLAATTAYLISPEWPFGRRMGTQISKNTFPAYRFHEKSRKAFEMDSQEQPKCIRSCRNGFTLPP